MAAETPQSPAPPTSSEPAKRRNLVPILIVAGVVVLAIIGVGVWKLTGSSSSSGASGEAPPRLAKNLYQAWQGQDRAAAAKSADPTTVTAIFAIPASEGSGLTFGTCVKTGATLLPKSCTFTGAGGTLTMTVSNVNGKRTITAVHLRPAATTPTSTTG
jgi:hypothetical protein